ncbi:MAG: rhodanese-like domain-containing protein [Desulfuromonadales bacterium]
MAETTVKRIKPEEARRRMDSGKALLVCAYEADEKFQSMPLEGAESLHQFRQRLPNISKDQEIIFYCA